MNGERTMLSERELLDWMTRELQREPRFRKCRFAGIERVGTDEAGGCNWVTALLYCDAAPGGNCMAAANAVIDEAKGLFDVAVEPAGEET